MLELVIQYTVAHLIQSVLLELSPGHSSPGLSLTGCPVLNIIHFLSLIFLSLSLFTVAIEIMAKIP